MATNQTLKAVVTLETRKAISEIKKLTGKLGSITSAVKSAFSVASIAMFGRTLINVGKDFEDAMARVKAVTNASVGEFATLTAAARKMGETTKYTATEAAEALEKLSRDGMKAVEASQALPAVLKLAQANAIDLAKAADILKVSLNMFGLQATDAARVSDVLSTTAANTATNIEELYDAMINVAPAAKVLGFSIEEVSAAIGALAQRGMRGAAAGTQLRIGLIKMVDPKIIKKMQDFGIEIDESTMKAEGLYKTLKKFSDQNVSLEQLTEIFSQKGAVGVQMLVNSLDDLQYVMAQIHNQDSMGTTARMFKDGIGEMKKELDTLKSKWESTMINMFKNSSNGITGVVRFLQNIADLLRGTVKEALMVIITFTLPLLVKGIGSVITAVKNLKTAIKSLNAASWTNIITAIAQAALIAGEAIYGAFQRIERPVKEATKALTDFNATAVENKKEMEKLADELVSIGSRTNKTTEDYYDFVGVLDKMKSLFPDLAAAIEQAGKSAFKNNDWQKFRDTLDEIYQLQKNISSIKLSQELLEAQTFSIGQKMRMPTFTESNVYGWVGDTIERTLKKIGYSTGQIDNIFETMADIIVRAKTSADAYTDIVKYLDAVDEEILGHGQKDVLKLRSWITEIMGWKRTNGAKLQLAKVNTNEQKLLEEEVKLQQKIFDDAVNALIKEAKDEGHDYPKGKIEQLAQTYSDALFSYSEQARRKGFKDLEEQYKKQAQDIRKQYNIKDSAWEDLEGDAGKKTNSLEDAINKYTDAKQKLINQEKHGVISAEQYKDKLMEVGAETWETITGFDNLYDALAKIGGGARDVADEVKKAWGEMEGVKMKEAMAEAAKDTMDEVAKEMDSKKSLREKFASQYPTLNQRSTLFDGNKTRAQIAEENLKNTQRNAEMVEAWIKEAEANEGQWKAIIDTYKGGLLEMKALLEDLLKQADNEEILLKYEQELEKTEKRIKDLKEDLSFTKFNQQVGKASSGIRSFGDSLISLSKAKEEYNGTGFLTDEEIKKWEYYMAVIDSISDAFKALKSVAEGVQTVLEMVTGSYQLFSDMKLAKDEALTLADKKEATAAMQAAAANAGKSVSWVPFVGAALAVAAVGAVAAAIMSTKNQKFAKGGLVDYGTSSGDNTIARVNRGEMVLNKGQQANLFRMINNGTAGGGEVQFKIAGRDLIGVLRNERLLTTGKL